MASFHAKKRFGQHLLRYAEDARRIAGLLGADSTPEDIVEIGPGAGALTGVLAELYPDAQITAIEFDRDLIAKLENTFATVRHVRILQGDILKIDLSEFGPEAHVIGNLPYNISAPIIQWTVERCDSVRKAVFMLQREVALRLCSQPGSKDWSPLAIHTQLRFAVQREFDLGPDRFDPPPKVHSTVFSLTRINTTDRYPQFDESRAPEFETLVRHAFGSRRKSLINNLIAGYDISRENAIAVLRRADIDEQARAEQLGIDEFSRLLSELSAFVG